MKDRDISDETMNSIVQHTEGLAEDNSIHFSNAAVQMAERLDGVEASDIIEAHNP